MASTNPEHIAITECPTGVGATFHGLSRGPDALLSAGIIEGLESAGYTVTSTRPFDPVEGSMSVPDDTGVRDVDIAVTVNRKIKQQILSSLTSFQAGSESSSRPFQLILGGVCIMCPAIVSAFMEALPDRKVGVIWFDADADLSVPKETPTTTNVFGCMAFSQMVMREGAVQNGMAEFSAPRHDHDHDDADGSNASAEGVSNSTNTVLFGLNTTHQSVIPRDHLTYLLDNHYRVISSKSLSHSLEAARSSASQALNYLTANGIDTIIVHVDVDAIDGQEFPLGNIPNFTGTSFEQFMGALDVFVNDKRVVGLNLTEMNPDRDTGLVMTKRLVERVVEIFRRRAGEFEGL